MRSKIQLKTETKDQQYLWPKLLARPHSFPQMHVAFQTLVPEVHIRCFVRAIQNPQKPILKLISFRREEGG